MLYILASKTLQITSFLRWYHHLIVEEHEILGGGGKIYKIIPTT